MTPECLVKLKPLVSDTVYDSLKKAQEAGDQKAWDLTMEASHADMKMLKRRAIINANRRQAVVSYVIDQEAKGIKPSQAIQDLLSGSSVRQASGVVSVDRYIQGVRGEYTAQLIDLIDATRPTMLGLRRASNPDFIKNIVKGVFGDADAAIPKGGQAIIDAWHRTTKSLLDRFNATGGDIAELKEFYIPLNHYAPSILKVGEEKWIADAKRLFKLRRKAGAPAISDDDLLRKVYKSLTEETDLSFGEGLGKQHRASMGTAHQQFRTLQPKSGDAWLEYTKLYGQHSNPVDAMKEYVDGMATEIALMEVLGTNPYKMVEDLVQEARRIEKNPRAGTLAMNTFDHIRARQPRAEDGITNVFRGLRAFQTITKLPLSGITALTDAAFTSVRSAYLGMNPVKIFMRQAKNLVTMGDYKVAGKLGMLAEYANNVAISAHRYTESLGFSKLDRIADFALRANGLNHWTNSGKAVFGMEFLSHMAENAAKGADQLPTGLKRAFERYGITDADWAKMRNAVTDVKGTSFLDPTSESLEGNLRARIIGMIKEETSWAIPEPNAKIRAIASLGAAKNTVWHEVISTGMQFKTFGVSTLVSNMGMLLDKSLPNPTKLAYTISLLVASSVMGAVVLQLKDIAKGRNPREMDASFVKDAIGQSGFLGVAWDLVAEDPHLFGGLPGRLTGPTISDMNRIAKVMFATKDEVLKEGGDWAKVLYPAVEQAAEEIAFPLKLWQVRVAMERLILDQARRWADPKYDQKLRRTSKWLKEERGQTYWSKPK